MKKVFLSYALDDRAHAERLRRILEGDALTVSLDGDVDAATGWRVAVRHVLRESSAIIALLSPNEGGFGVNQLFEVGIAIGIGLPVVAVLIQGDPDRIPTDMKSFRWVDARRMGDEELATEVRAALEREHESRGSSR
jgi:hypothetical protein